MSTHHPHRRFDPLRGEWVIVSPNHNDRPWQGQVDPAPAGKLAPFDPGCYLCPGNARANGERNPPYTSTFTFDNDFGVPHEAAVEQRELAAYSHHHGSCLLCDYTALELRLGERIVCANDGFAAIVPFWAVWPFETLVVSTRHVDALPSLRDVERDALADILKQLTTRYDNLFEAPFPYSMGFHQQPMQGAADGIVHLHAHFYPPLLRSASVRKFMVGFELLGSPQRDFTPEDAGARLRAMSPVHYAERAGAGASR
jgi:galactose-1-phosphate uridylyltransferase